MGVHRGSTSQQARKKTGHEALKLDLAYNRDNIEITDLNSHNDTSPPPSGQLSENRSNYTVDIGDFGFQNFAPDQRLMAAIDKMKILPLKSQKECVMSCGSDLPELLRDLEQERNKFLVIMYYLDKLIHYSKEHLGNKQEGKG